MECILWGIVGGSAVLLVNRSETRFRPTEGSNVITKRSLSSIASWLTFGLKESFTSIKTLFIECKAEEDATRIAIDEVRNLYRTRLPGHKFVLSSLRQI